MHESQTYGMPPHSFYCFKKQNESRNANQIMLESRESRALNCKALKTNVRFRLMSRIKISQTCWSAFHGHHPAALYPQALQVAPNIVQDLFSWVIQSKNVTIIHKQSCRRSEPTGWTNELRQAIWKHDHCILGLEIENGLPGQNIQPNLIEARNTAMMVHALR